MKREEVSSVDPGSNRDGLYVCDVLGCKHTEEWCNRNRRQCDRLVPASEPGYATQCGKPTVWLAPFEHPAFPLAYCAEHVPDPRDPFIARGGSCG